MYFKLVLKSAEKSAKDYLIYMITMTVCVAMFYSFLSISSRYYKPDIGSEYDFVLLSDGMKAAIYSITLLIIFLINFVNKYMLKQKQKEFAVQSVIGMEQKIIGRLFFAQTFIMGIVSIAAGIFAGVFCSQFITAMLLTNYGKSYKLSWMLFPDTVLLTIGFFVFSFAVVGLLNTGTIRKTKIINMLSADRENDIQLKNSRWMPIAVIFYELFALWMCAVGVQKIWFYYDSRLHLPVKIMLWCNIIFPVFTLLWPFVRLIIKKKSFSKLIAGLVICAVLNTCAAAAVPFLKNRYYLSLGDGTVNQYLLFILIDLIFLICSLFYLIGNIIVWWKEKSPQNRYKNENLFFFGQIISKLNTTSKTMTLICLTLVLSVFMFISAPILVGWAYGYLEERSVYDIQIFSAYNNVYDEKNLPCDNYEPVENLLNQYNIKTVYDCTFSLYLPRKDDFHNRYKYDFPVAAISLSDYNYIRKMLGYEPVELSDNEFTTQWKSIAEDEEIDSFLKSHIKITTDAGELTLAHNAFYEESLGETMYNSYTDVIYVFPDSVCEKLMSVIKNKYIITSQNIPYENAVNIQDSFTNMYPEMTDSGVRYGIRLSTLQINSTKASTFVLQSSMIYAAVVLMVICLTVLSLQQLMDLNKYRYRFSVLRKLGVEESNIDKLVLKQLGVWFALPVAVALAVSFVLIIYFIQVVSAEISAYINFSLLISQIGFISSILILLLICYFISTWILFKRSID